MRARKTDTGLGAPVESRALRLDGEGAVYRQIERALRARISTGRWRPGELVPPERQLVSELGVSRMTVNRALAAMTDDGLLIRRRRAGTIVAEPSRRHAVFAIPDIRDEMAAAGRTHSFRLLTHRTRRANAADRELLDVAAGTYVLWLCGVHAGDGRPELHEERLINLDLVPDARAVLDDNVAPGSWLLEQVPWTRAAFAISASVADRSMALALRIKPGTALLVQERRTWRGPDAVTWVRLNFCGERHVLSGEIAP
jgi:GntR family transcriptional regulator, histidine utilization repressor